MLSLVFLFTLIVPGQYAQYCGPEATNEQECLSRIPPEGVPCCAFSEGDICVDGSDEECPTTTTTAAPTTPEPTTAAPTTAAPTTTESTTAEPTTVEPTSILFETTEFLSTTPTCICDDLVGQFCWCKADSCDTTTTPSPTTLAATSSKDKKSKAKKSKGKKKKQKKSSKDQGEVGCGDCECNKDFGMTYMELINRGTETVDVEYFDKAGSTLICGTTNTARGDVSECDASHFGSGDFETNTVVVVTPTAGGGASCTTEIHTSCSSSIIGTIGSVDCGVEVTKWRDDTECTNGYVLCGHCDHVETTKLSGVQNTVGDKCFCPTALLTARRRRLGKNDAPLLGVSATPLGCDCDKSGSGMQLLRMRWSGPTEAASITFTGEKSGAFFCSFSNVAPGDEITCRASDSQNEKYETNTEIVVTGATACAGAVHTSCSQDIVGWTATGCEYLVVTGWADGDGDCDDGFEECPCDAFANAFRLSAAHDMVSQSVFALAMVVAVATMLG